MPTGDPSWKDALERMRRLGYLSIERNMAMLWELSSPWSPPDTGGGTGKSDQYLRDAVNAGFLAWRTLGDKDGMLQGFLIETPMGRRWEREHPDRDGDGDYDLSTFFWNVLGVFRDVHVDNAGFAPHWHRQNQSPLSVLRRCGLVRKNPDGEFQWLAADGTFRPFPEVTALEPATR